MQIPAGYSKLTESLEAFFADSYHKCQNYEQNVFIMTRFQPGNPTLELIDSSIRRILKSRGLHGHRADDCCYPADRNLWDNVCTYMIGCRYGIAVLEDVIHDEFNPNVALEYGFMRALNKPTLLLKEQRFKPRADIIGTLWEDFNILNIEKTVTEAIARWLDGLGIKRDYPILILAEEGLSLRSSYEFREIETTIRETEMRDLFPLQVKSYTRLEDIKEVLLETKPRIVHLPQGKENSGMLMLEEESGTLKAVKPHALVDALEDVADYVDCVVLNFSYSSKLAMTIAKSIKYVVGMSEAFNDRAAVTFAKGFYQALGYGRSIEDAYKLGRFQLNLENLPEYEVPVLFVRD